MMPQPSASTGESSAAAHARWYEWWYIGGLVLLGVFAGWIFFHRLGAENLKDWDEAWHAQVASEILSTGDWLTLHDRGRPYFNKPPLSFWLKAVSFRIGGVNETTARFFPALFGWGSVVLSAIFFGKLFDRLTGLLAALILCTSWLFTLYHAGRSGETDSTLIFFLLTGFACLWQARQNPRRFYAAGILTALGAMTKGSTAFLIWPIALLGSLMSRPQSGEQLSPAAVSVPTPASAAEDSRPPVSRLHGRAGRARHICQALVLAVALILPWQIAMLAIHGRAFAKVFYVGEGALPAFQAVENHPGNPAFHIMVLHSFFQPWFLLAFAATGWSFIRRATTSRQVFWVIALAASLLAAATLFATKMVWYSTPALPAIAALAALAMVGLCRRRGGWIVLALIAWFSYVQTPGQNWASADRLMAGGLALGAIAILTFSPPARDRWQPALGAACLIVPLTMHFIVVRNVIERGTPVAAWTDLGVDDEPWRELCSRIDGDLSGRAVVLIDFPMHPAAYFYLHHLREAVEVKWIGRATLAETVRSEPRGVFVARVELSNVLRATGLIDRGGVGALRIWILK